MDKIRLESPKIFEGQFSDRTIILILSVENSNIKIPIIINEIEALAIENMIALEDPRYYILPPRPLMHDIFNKLASNFQIKLNEVFILTFEIPIFKTKDVIKKAGCDIDIAELQTNSGAEFPSNYCENTFNKDTLSELSINELQHAISEAINSENYELAAIIKEEINKRENK